VLVWTYNKKVGTIAECWTEFPAGKQKCPFFIPEKWTLQGLWKDFAMTFAVDEVTARTLSNIDFVERSLHGRL
jgi:hypothetical protein